jgi:hypothetical protein
MAWGSIKDFCTLLLSDWGTTEGFVVVPSTSNGEKYTCVRYVWLLLVRACCHARPGYPHTAALVAV